jgi:hypothetical protein
MIKARPFTGASAIALAIAFNIPYAILAATYDYPDVLRRPAGEALDLFAAGGPELILTWHCFALSALALALIAIALSLTPARIAEKPGLAIGAAIMGSLAGLAQAIGLWRWVFVIPGLAHTHADPASTPDARLAAERAFDLLNQYGGVAIGASRPTSDRPVHPDAGLSAMERASAYQRDDRLYHGGGHRAWNGRRARHCTWAVGRGIQPRHHCGFSRAHRLVHRDRDRFVAR